MYSFLTYDVNWKTQYEEPKKKNAKRNTESENQTIEGNLLKFVPMLRPAGRGSVKLEFL